ncbi:GntR family transcriptional regulator [Achromobacter spanius]|uniref:GntR family transcriptional regulator n=1 Tax=Achromobacter spanius TaxID=217203 RepID=A0A2S0IAK1_9BURK|nr:GntR family transcriptional regulator [Achromobacter spanius]AVJ29079.1 GntR family transcriptional regulator [Achromobacter spanius]
MESAFAAIDMPRTLADSAYTTLKRDILEFRLAPGDRFTETEIADRLQVSRTPVREALFRLEREGYLEVRQRNGWLVKPLDFETLDHFYELRSVLEAAAVHALCAPGQSPDPLLALRPLAETWLVDENERSSDCEWLADLDERFHVELVAAAGNPEIARVHRAATERIRIVRRLDFTQPDRIGTTYREHGAILSAVLACDGARAAELLRAHIKDSQDAVRKITLHRLYATRRAKAA